MSANGRTGIVPRVAGLLGLLALASPMTALAQFSDCQDTLALVSPTGLDIEFVESPVQGNQLWWPALDASAASCFRSEVPSALAVAIAPEFLGDWADLADRQVSFTGSSSGAVGSKTDLSVRLSLESNPPNPAVPALSAVINLSGAGGLFRADLGNSSAIQQNSGLPEHLPSTDVTAIAATTLPGASTRVYAAVTGIPVVRSDDGGATWFEPLQGDSPIATEALNLAISPNDASLVFMGTPRDGLLRSNDGGQTWVAADSDLRSPDQAVRVLFLKYLTVDTGTQLVDRLYLSLRGLGFYFSDDDGANWTAITNLQVPVIGTTVECNSTNLRRPDVESVAVSPSDQRTLYLGLRQWGVYKGSVDHAVWTPAYDGIVICALNGDAGSTANVVHLEVHPQSLGGEDVLFAATEFRGIFVSTDGATNWSDISQTAAFPKDSDGFLEEVSSIAADPTEGQAVLAGFTNAGLWRWSQSLGDWVRFDDTAGVFNRRIGSIERLPGTQEFLIGTTGSGVYEVGDEIPLSRVLAGTGVDLGLSLRFNGSGSLSAGDRFDLFGQAFQAYAVWRALSTDPVSGEPQWQLIGLYDLTNPEFCSVDPCDSPTQNFIPDCFADKRANCFNLRVNNGVLEWGFFDPDVFNGFTYHYAVSTLDYGYTGNVSPRVFDGDFVFSPRHPAESSDQSAMFLGVRPDNFAYRVFQANASPRAGLGEVYAVPNPLQRRGAWDIGTGESTVRFANVTDTSKVQIFTLAGDLVRVLDNVVTGGQERGNIQWDTRNAEGNQVASGVYIYRVTDATGAEFVSKVTIIR